MGVFAYGTQLAVQTFRIIETGTTGFLCSLDTCISATLSTTFSMAGQGYEKIEWEDFIIMAHVLSPEMS